MNSLSIVIPAYNEEEAIENIIIRTKQSISKIKNALDFDFIDIIVVNDGSRDRTLEIAKKHEGIKIISYLDNRGYGYAIKRGFELAKGDIVGFLDADGTCDPDFFVELCKPIKNDEADIVLGNRLTSTSRMPFVRKVGNTIYAKLLRFLSGKVVRDTASGMRVIRKDKLALIYPLPDGLHFTPAMSAKALFDKEIRIKEIDMHYEERIGESKLHVLRDGIRFFEIILQTAFAYRPMFIYYMLTIVFWLIALIYSIYPVNYYLTYRRVEDFVYYRLSTIVILFIVSAVTFNLGLIHQRITVLRNRSILQPENFWERNLGYFGILLILSAFALNSKGIITYILERRVDLHWVYILTGSLFSILGIIFIFTKIIYSTINFLKYMNIQSNQFYLSKNQLEELYHCNVYEMDS